MLASLGQNLPMDIQAQFGKVTQLIDNKKKSIEAQLFVVK
jgi:hypothetical protein